MIREELSSYAVKETLTESQTDIMKLDSKTQLKVIAQYEALRQTGQYNMLSFLEVQRQAFENKFYEFVSFTANDRRAYASILKNYSKLIKLLSNKKTHPAKKLVTHYSLEESRFTEACSKKKKRVKEENIDEAKSPSLRAELLKKFGSDPIYKDAIVATNEADFKKACDTLKSIRGAQAYKDVTRFIKNFQRENGRK